MSSGVSHSNSFGGFVAMVKKEEEVRDRGYRRGYQQIKLISTVGFSLGSAMVLYWVLASDRLKGLPMWIFHSKDDVIFPVRCSDELVKDLRPVNDNVEGKEWDMVQYTRFEEDQDGFTGRVSGHITGIMASKDL